MAKNIDWEFYHDVVQSEECVCGQTKKNGFPFCVKCYYELPKDLQENCAYGIHQWFPEAYEKSVKYLEEAGRC